MFDTLFLLENISEQSANTIAIIIDVVLVVALLVFILHGFVKGFIDSILKLIGTIGAIAVGIFCAKPVATFLNGVININSWFSGVGAGMCKGDSLNAVIQTEADRQLALESLNGSDLPSTIKTFFTNIVNGMPLGEISVAQAVDASVSALIAIVVTGIVLFLAVKLVIFLLGKLFDSIEDKRGGKSGLDRLFGAALGALKGGVVVVAIFIICSVLSVAYQPIGQTLQDTYIAKPGYNFVDDKVKEYVGDIDFNEIIDNLIKDDDGEQEPEA